MAAAGWCRGTTALSRRSLPRVVIIRRSWTGGSRFDAKQFEALVEDLAARMLGSGIRRHRGGRLAVAQLRLRAASLLGVLAHRSHRGAASPQARGVGGDGRARPGGSAAVVCGRGPACCGRPRCTRVAGRGTARRARRICRRPAGGRRVARRECSPAQGSDIAVVLFTSGSSGIPKAVLHTHRGLAYKARLMARVHGLRRGDPVLAPAPLAHVSGLLNGVLISAVVGGPCVLIDPWEPGEGLRLLEEERVAFMGAPPIFFSQMAGLPAFSRERVSALRLISTGGASVSPAFVDSTADAYGCRVKRTYGSTEAPTITTSGPDDPYERARDTDGHAVGEAEVEIHEPESGRPAGTGRGRRALDPRPRAVRRIRQRRADRIGDRRSRRVVPIRRSRIPRR